LTVGDGDGDQNRETTNCQSDNGIPHRSNCTKTKTEQNTSSLV
jgi:hypothetical protein